MIRARFSLNGSKIVFRRLTVLMLLVGALLIAGAARAQNICPNNILPLGNGESLAIDKECRVGNGTYKYADINIIAGGSLIFDEVNNSVIDFWARSIIIENEGKLIAGSPNAPFGSKDGQLTIHLWGSDQGVRGPGAVCKSPLNNNSPCGIPSDIWKSNGAEKVRLAGGEDYFYQYAPLPFDPPGYFGYKVLAVSYGGTLQLFGWKGATYTSNPDPKDSGRSWTRLKGTILPGATSLEVTRQVNWGTNDRIVVTTTDYVPNHSEELVVCSNQGLTISFSQPPKTNLPPCPPRRAFNGRTMGSNIRSIVFHPA